MGVRARAVALSQSKAIPVDVQSTRIQWRTLLTQFYSGVKNHHSGAFFWLLFSSNRGTLTARTIKRSGHTLLVSLLARLAEEKKGFFVARARTCSHMRL
jgi:hypothetical protein